MIIPRSTPLITPHDWWTYWLAIYVYNLPLVLIFGLLLIQDGGWIGMFMGIIVCWGVGQVICGCPGSLRSALVSGGYVMFILQGFLIVHVLAGVLALSVVAEINGTRFQSESSRVRLEMMGFAVTILTVQPLMALAILFGYIARWSGQVPARYNH